MENIEEEKVEHGSEAHSETHHSGHGKHKSKKTHWIIAGVVGLVVLVVAGGLAWLYTGKISNAKEKVFTKLPLPAAIVDTTFVSAKEALARIELAKQLAAAQGAGMAAEPDAAQIFEQLITTKKLSAIVSSRNLKVTNEAIDEEYKNIVTQYGGGDEEKFKTQLEQTYKMSPDKFKNEVIRQELEQSELAIWYSKQEELNKDAYKTANDLKGKLDGGQSFDEVAKVYTQDEATKDFAGDSGLIAYDELLPEFRTELKDVKVGDIKMVPSRYGLHILKVLELNNDGENGAKKIHLQQIFVKQVGFADWLDNETNNVRVINLLKF